MPIGWDPGDSGGGQPPRPPATEPRPHDSEPDDPWDRWREAEPIIWDVWRTNGDERVCPICGPLAGLEYQAGHGPTPPLHPNCRCIRVTSRIEWLLR